MFKTISETLRPAKFFTNEGLSVSPEQLQQYQQMPARVVRPCEHTLNVDIAAISRAFIGEGRRVHGLVVTMATSVECFSVQVEVGDGVGRLLVRQTTFDPSGGTIKDQLHQCAGSPTDNAKMLAQTVDGMWVANQPMPLGVEMLPMDTLHIPSANAERFDDGVKALWEGHSFPTAALGVLAVASGAKFWQLREGAFLQANAATARAHAAAGRPHVAATASSPAEHYELTFGTDKLGFHLARGATTVLVNTVQLAESGRQLRCHRDAYPVVHSTQRPDLLPHPGDGLVAIGGHRLADCLPSHLAAAALKAASDASGSAAGAAAAEGNRRSIADVLYGRSIELIRRCPRPVRLLFERRYQNNLQPPPPQLQHMQQHLVQQHLQQQQQHLQQQQQQQHLQQQQQVPPPSPQQTTAGLTAAASSPAAVAAATAAPAAATAAAATVAAPQSPQRGQATATMSSSSPAATAAAPAVAAAPSHLSAAAPGTPGTLSAPPLTANANAPEEGTAARPNKTQRTE